LKRKGLHGNSVPLVSEHSTVDFICRWEAITEGEHLETFGTPHKTHEQTPDPQGSTTTVSLRKQNRETMPAQRGFNGGVVLFSSYVPDRIRSLIGWYQM